jgi:hypothetical protein
LDSGYFADDLRRTVQSFTNKTVKKCSVYVEDSNVVVSDAKGKKVIVTFGKGDIATAEIQRFRYYGGDKLGFHDLSPVFAVVELKDGQIFGFLHGAESSDVRPNQLVAALGGSPGKQVPPSLVEKARKLVLISDEILLPDLARLLSVSRDALLDALMEGDPALGIHVRGDNLTLEDKEGFVQFLAGAFSK